MLLERSRAGAIGPTTGRQRDKSGGNVEEPVFDKTEPAVRLPVPVEPCLSGRYVRAGGRIARPTAPRLRGPRADGPTISRARSIGTGAPMREPVVA